MTEDLGHVFIPSIDDTTTGRGHTRSNKCFRAQVLKITIATTFTLFNLWEVCHFQGPSPVNEIKVNKNGISVDSNPTLEGIIIGRSPRPRVLVFHADGNVSILMDSFLLKQTENKPVEETSLIHHPNINIQVNNDATPATSKPNHNILADNKLTSIVHNHQPSSMQVMLNTNYSECVQIQEWAKWPRPTCNVVHEIDLLQKGATPLGSGLYRMAWKVPTREEYSASKKQGRESHDFVLKTVVKVDVHYDESLLNKHVVDAILSERLTRSINAIDIWSYCSHAVVNELAVETLQEFLARNKRRYTSFSSLQKLRLCKDVAQGIRDLHKIDAVNRDFYTKNIVMGKDGRLKISDFNLGEFLLWNQTSDTWCSLKKQLKDREGSPEEIQGHFLTEKTDVYALGNIMHQILTGRRPYHGKSDNHVYILKKKGIKPGVRKIDRESTDAIIVLLRTMISRCFAYNPDERPSASQLVQAMERELLSYSAGNE